MGGPGLLLALTAAKYLQQQSTKSSTGSISRPAGLTEYQQWKTDKAAMHVMVFGHDSSSQPVANAYWHVSCQRRNDLRRKWRLIAKEQLISCRQQLI